MSGKLATIIDNKKQCRKCLLWKDTALFGTFLDKKGKWVAPKRYINSRCKECAKQVSTLWTNKNRERVYKRWVENKNRFLGQIYNAYGNKCACCGEINKLFLTIDHINNDGYKIRTRNKKDGYSQSEFSGTYYQKIIKANFPKDLQLLCWNCNCGKARNKGICPHKIK